jgi:hypothetical protein
MSIEVTENSPQHLVFKVANPEGVTYTGRVLHAITGEPVAGAFVAVNCVTGDDNLSRVIPEEWEALHKLPRNPLRTNGALSALGYLTMNLSHEKITRTDEQGRFELHVKPSERHHGHLFLTAFEEGFLSSQRTFGDGAEFVENGRWETEPVRLFPAAKVKIYPYVMEFNEGKPCIDAANINCFLEILNEGSERSKIASIFFELYGGFFSSGIITSPRINVNWTRTYYVPAGFSYKVKFLITSGMGYKWERPGVPHTINLKQGETMDLGKYEFIRGAKIEDY